MFPKARKLMESSELKELGQERAAKDGADGFEERRRETTSSGVAYQPRIT
jgi:hypothetical protein